MKCQHPKNTRKFRGNGRPYCNECNVAKAREWYNRKVRESPEEMSAKGRAQHLKTRFNLTQQEYDSLLVKQGGVCKICMEYCASGKRLAVDHDHITNKIRGLLCRNCNAGLGQFKDKISVMLRAVSYLEENRSE